MTWIELTIMIAGVLLVIYGCWRFVRLVGAAAEEQKMRARGTHWEVREVMGKKVAIETSNDNPHQADVIAETLRTGKPVFGTYDKDGNFVMEVLGDDD